MDEPLTVGTATAAPGERADGWIHATGLPTGGSERLPVTVINGADAGPVLWVTGGVHGDEATGVAVAQDVAAAFSETVGDGTGDGNGVGPRDEDATLAGAVVVVPVVNPAGLRRNERTSYYGGDDPNRYFPDTEREDSRPPETQERIDSRLFDALAESADLLVDCHTAQVGSMPFTIRDRVLYGEERTEAEAEDLAEDLDRLATALGLPILTEYPAEEYVEQSLQRSTAGAALNTAGVPAVTAELGGHSVVEEDARRAGVAGIVAAAVEFGLLDSVPAGVAEAGAGVPNSPIEYPVRRFVGPRVEEAGLVRHRVAVGEAVEAGDAVAEVVTPHGEVVESVESEHDGYVIGRAEGVAVYEGNPVASMAVRDDGDLVVPRDRDDAEE
ncbi:succinylglutamate desuccinylase/aspartoacylase family protein [Halobaculum magnesiiphilum]|uniref:Succinylglutamate desuccinylase/aspartoacylase family protein n=1 Tax=Halobaculum magnesiiphilum TaxID=1017351 RepID=A0A8T8WGA4_9EURY|nr:succinylglutamate desuccinylase/aspartoacylase family protein [Halobaculum magnesiiphilum]QZP38816.1 succinylglutamate desuccinylase/aspartoacylase family protein [Halobaculum magnesiiphilum]